METATEMGMENKGWIKMELVQYIIVNNSLGMNKGKIAAQASHASVSVLDKADDSVINDWKDNGMKKIVLKVATTEELLALFEKAKKRFPCALITDAGKTQIAPGSKTCFACGPIEEEEGQKMFGELKLL
jgi:peptidyl-tRNA hydrolase, PTH2 family